MRTPAPIFRQLGDENKLRVLRVLLESQKLGCDVCACELCDIIGTKPSTLSGYLHSLQDIGLITSRKFGTWRYFRLSDNIPKYIYQAIQASDCFAEDVSRLKQRYELRECGLCCLPVGALNHKEVLNEQQR
jgi:ArsR family transcriptional regulator